MFEAFDFFVDKLFHLAKHCFRGIELGADRHCKRNSYRVGGGGRHELEAEKRYYCEASEKEGCDGDEGCDLVLDDEAY
ncbi:MAG: hypothetical protein BWY39_01447 [Spirochaetes bacterium ADurb.Bin269]|nr:MAG: hypothetical protein BWY39_01447 [Spirochaetes bacterium ADurb.Bin269]